MAYAVCVGFGFMCVENLKYFILIGTSPDIGESEGMAEFEGYWLRRFLVF